MIDFRLGAPTLLVRSEFLPSELTFADLVNKFPPISQRAFNEHLLEDLNISYVP